MLLDRLDYGLAPDIIREFHFAITAPFSLPSGWCRKPYPTGVFQAYTGAKSFSGWAEGPFSPQ